MEKKKINFAWLVLIGVIIIRGFTFGGLNLALGLSLGPVAADMGVGLGALSIYMSISALAMLIFLPFAGKIAQKYNMQTIVLASIVLQAGSFIGFAFMDSMIGFYILSIPNAIGGTILVNLMGPILVNRWFTKNKGLVMGISVSAVGIIAAILQPMATSMIASQGWRYTFIALGIASLVAVILCAIFLIRTKPLTNMAASANTAKEQKPEVPGVPYKSAVKTRAFYFLLIFTTCITGLGVFQQHIVNYGVSIGYEIATVGFALSAYSIGNAIGAIVLGILSDKIGAIRTSKIISIVGMLAVAMFFISNMGFVTFAAAAFMQGFTTSAINVLTPLLVIAIFGQKDYIRIFSSMMLSAPIASIILIPLYGFAYDAFGNYTFVLSFLIGLLLVGLISISFTGSKKPKLEPSLSH